MNDELLNAFLKAQQFLGRPKLARWAQKPLRYVLALTWSYGLYPVLHKGLSARCSLFTGNKITVPLPAGLDLYLAGLKSHPSELRLVRYMLNTLTGGDVAIDAGAHLGYFTLVMAACVTEEGVVVAFEPSERIAVFLRRNTLHKLQVRTEKWMLSAGKGESTFHEFSLRNSEFNTSILRVSEKTLPSKSKVVSTTSLDEYCKEYQITPVFLKLDVEGGEYNILKGALTILDEVKSIAIELRKRDYPVLYAPAVALLEQMGFIAFQIEDDGTLKHLPDVGAYIESLADESDNVVFRREPGGSGRE
jgi:FkbM family methyltransferase